MTDQNNTKGSASVDKLKSAYAGWGYVKMAGALISGIAIFAMMLLIVADVVSRNFLGGSISGSFEIAQNYFMPLSVFPALAYVYGSGVLPKMDLLMHRFPATAQRAVVHLLLALEVVIFALLTYYTWGYAMDGMARGVAFPAGGTLFTLWPLFFLVPIGFAMVLVETIFVIIRNVTSDVVALAMLQVEAEGL